ncbi:capsid protein, partial [Burkholderia pseudomallei]|nr:capsid protein [Burkholderia pseudomallei]
MTNIQTGAERMPHDLSHLGFLAGQIGRLITISTTPVIAGDSFEMDAVGALRLSPLRRGLAIDSTVDIFTFYVPHRHVYGEQGIKRVQDCLTSATLPAVHPTGSTVLAAFLATLDPDSSKISRHLFHGHLTISTTYVKSPCLRDLSAASPTLLHPPARG